MAGEVCVWSCVLPEQGREPESNEFYNFSTGIKNQLNQLSNPARGLPAVVGSIPVSGICSRTEVGTVDLRIPDLLINYLDINIVTGNSIWFFFSF